MQLRAIDWVIILGYVSVTIGGALCLRRYVTGVATFLVAGRKVRKFLLTSTGSSTEVGIIAVVMMAQEAYVNGPVAMSVPIIALFALLTMGLTGFCVYRLRQTKALTLGHYAEMRYGSRSFRIFAGIPLLIAGVSTIAMLPAVAGTFFTYFLGWPEQIEICGVALRTSAVVAAVLLTVILGYTLVSGAVGLIFSDFMQFIIIWAALFITTICVVKDVSWGQIVATFKSTHGTDTFSTLGSRQYGLSWVAFMFLQYLYGSVVWPPVCARVLSAKHPKVSKQLYILTALMQPGRMGMIILMGLGAAVVVTAADLPAAHQVLLGSPALAAMPLYMAKILPPLGITLFLAGLLAAHVGTVNSYVLAWSGVLTQDIVVPLCKKAPSEATQVRINRAMIALLGVAIYAWAIHFSLTETLFTYIMLTAATYTAGAAAFITCGLYWKRANKVGAWCGMLLGMSLPLTCVVATGFFGASFMPGKWVGILSYFLAFAGMVGGTLVGERFLEPRESKTATGQKRGSAIPAGIDMEN